MRHRTRHLKQHRSGSVAVFAAFLLVLMLGMVAFAVDVGYLSTVRSELQRSADAAAMAGAWELVETSPPGTPPDLTAEIESARQVAAQYAGSNFVCNSSPGIDTNAANSSDGDVVVGYLSDPSDPDCQMTFGDPNQYNAMQVRVRRTAGQNGEVPLFFARIFGIDSHALSAQATGALLKNLSGFRAPLGGGNVNVLPLALDQDTWDSLLDGSGEDDWQWDESLQQATPGWDGVLEANLYPQGTGSPGNRGTVDIGSNNNSTADLARQIVDGVSPSDLEYHGGELKFDSSGRLYLNGDPGISAGIKDELESIIGKPRIIPVFSEVVGPGNNAQYTIVRFAGVRIMDVKLTGSASSKRVIIQPANVVTRGGIPATGGQQSYSVYSPVWLVR